MVPLPEVMLSFEALGDNCEFGLVQRQAGVEPLGLLRFAGFHIPVERRLARLLEALDARFDGLGTLSTVRVEAAGAEGRREFLVFESAWNLMYHTFQLEGQVDPETLRDQEAKKLQFLRRKLLTDLGGAEKIWVWKSNLRIGEQDVQRLASRLRAFGPNLLFWVDEADEAHPAGSVEVRGEGLIKGYVDRFAPYSNATAISYQPWFRVCDEAYRLTRAMA
jgi:hypothetical protein